MMVVFHQLSKVIAVALFWCETLITLLKVDKKNYYVAIATVKRVFNATLKKKRKRTTTNKSLKKKGDVIAFLVLVVAGCLFYSSVLELTL